ncbi:MAG: hypothetical protein J6B52_04860 [Clostridia bacterium]|nr:hypothetical protein [Clostridia bacterium]
MKKIISVSIAAILLVMSVFSVNAFAADTTKTEALLDKLNTSKEVAVSLKAGDIPLFGSNSNASDTVYIKGDKAAYEYNAGFFNVRVVLDGDEIIAYLPIFPYVHVKLESSAIGSVDVWGLIEDATKVTMGVLAYVGTYEEELGGIKYTVEEFNDRAQVTSKFYYQGDDLKLLNVVDKQTNSVQNTYFESISFDVDDSVFELPAISFDLTPVLQGLFLALIAA